MLLVATRPHTERRHSCPSSSSERVCLSSSWKSSSFRSVLTFTTQWLCSEYAISLCIISSHRDWKSFLSSCDMRTQCALVLTSCYRLSMITRSWLWLERQAQGRPPRSLSTWRRLDTQRVGKLAAHSPEEWLPCLWLREYLRNTVVVWDRR